MSFLSENGFECRLSYIIDKNADKYFYESGHFIKKGITVAKSILIRLRDVLQARKYDIIFIQREAIMLGTTLFERLFRFRGVPLVFDFDDSIWLQDLSEANKAVLFLKNPGKTSKIIQLSNLIFAGNDYLADYARKFNKNVIVLPTTIDTTKYVPTFRTKTQSVTLGWSGSFSTIKHFTLLRPVLIELKHKYKERLSIKVIGSNKYTDPELGITGISWTEENELRELNTFDIGVMPLPDDSWSKGKCGLKGLQYMALSIPTVMSPVGVNQSIIQDGVNGYLAATHDEWITKLSLLIDSEQLRNELGRAGRKTVEAQYSVESQKLTYLDQLNSLISAV